jgi:hypothetical protein
VTLDFVLLLEMKNVLVNVGHKNICLLKFLTEINKTIEWMFGV